MKNQKNQATIKQATIKQATAIVRQIANLATSRNAAGKLAREYRLPGETITAATDRLWDLIQMADTEATRRKIVRMSRDYRKKEGKYTLPKTRFRVPAGTINCEDTIDVGAPGLTITERHDYDRYSKGWHSRYGAAKTTVRHWTIPADYHYRVVARGLSVVDGLSTLWAHRLVCPTPGVEAFAATWAVQGRGNNITLHHGVIARQIAGDLSYHGADLASACAGLARKSAKQASTRAGRDLLAALIERIWRAGGIDCRLAPIEITVADSLRAGNCQDGTEGFLRRLGYQDLRATTTLGELWSRIEQRGWDASEAHTLRQCAAAALCAIRRARKTALLTA